MHGDEGVDKVNFDLTRELTKENGVVEIDFGYSSDEQRTPKVEVVIVTPIKVTNGRTYGGSGYCGPWLFVSRRDRPNGDKANVGG